MRGGGRVGWWWWGRRDGSEGRREGPGQALWQHLVCLAPLRGGGAYKGRGQGVGVGCAYKGRGQGVGVGCA